MLAALSFLLGTIAHPYALFIGAITVLAAILAKGFPIVKEWIGFKKEVLDYEKTKMEIAEARSAKSQRIVLATDAEIKEFDPRYRKIRAKAEQDEFYYRASILPLVFAVVLIIILLAVGIYFVFRHYK